MDFLRSARQYVSNKTEGTSPTTLAVSGIISVTGLYFMNKWHKQWRLQQNLRAFEEQSIAEDKIIVHMSPYWDLSLHPSPFVARVLTFLEKNEIPYIVDTTMPMHFYTQKMPWITYKRHHQPDSSLIIDWIKTQSDFGYLDMDKHLDSKQVATSTAFKSMIDGGLTSVIGVRRWGMKQNLTVYGDLLFGTMGMAPWQVRLMMPLIKGKVQKALWIQGIGRFSEIEVFQRGERILSALVESIGENKFFFGDQLSSVDIWIYATCSSMYQLSRVMTWGGKDDTVPSKMPYAKEMSEYLKRVEIECFGELKYWKDLDL